MKNFLPKTSRNLQGFTLIELLVVVSIMAILAVIGISVFANTQGRARDSRRISDIESIATSLESNYLEPSATPYSLVNTVFSQGQIPQDPFNTGAGARRYCYYSSAVATGNPVRGTNPAAGAGWTTTGCPAIGAITGTALQINTAVANTTWYKVCALMDDNTAVNCRDNSR